MSYNLVITKAVDIVQHNNFIINKEIIFTNHYLENIPNKMLLHYTLICAKIFNVKYGNRT
jgi:hypothetical protein